MAHGTYDNPRAGNNSSKIRIKELVNRVQPVKMPDPSKTLRGKNPFFASEKAYTAELRPLKGKERDYSSEEAKQAYTNMKRKATTSKKLEDILTYSYKKANPKARGYGK